MDIQPIKSRSAADQLVHELESLEKELSSGGVIYSFGRNHDGRLRTDEEQYEFNSNRLVELLEVRRRAIEKLQVALASGLRKEHKVVMRLVEYFHLGLCFNAP